MFLLPLWMLLIVIFVLWLLTVIVHYAFAKGFEHHRHAERVQREMEWMRHNAEVRRQAGQQGQGEQRHAEQCGHSHASKLYPINIHNPNCPHRHDDEDDDT